MKLRVKDLQHFLAKRRINIKACVGEALSPGVSSHGVPSPGSGRPVVPLVDG
jgi:hypothetical protein